ncbi:MAG: VacB/RNase II family 3'-5' exoribonuclease [Acidobacteriota bacterium]|nr:VacB/RNase II family 3'-5' exoribonuclease [Acidobacteriota bacterium]
MRGRRSKNGERTDDRRRSSASPGAKKNTIHGRLIGHRDGYGFVVPDERQNGLDIFIPPHAMKDAMHGDRVEVQVFPAKPDPRRPGAKRLEGAIIRVIHHEQRRIVGEFHFGSRYNYVKPFDDHIAYEIEIPQGAELVAVQSAENRQFGRESETGPARIRRLSARELDGKIVDAEITSFPGRASPPRGRVIEVLGARDDFGVDVEIMIRKFHLPHRFPPEVLAAEAIAPGSVTDADRIGRQDFRPLPIVTIDGETAKDFDDAVLVERLPGGNYLLQVHIADVAHYIRPGTAIDGEARLRGTSVYFPDRAVPMLPLGFSNGICSLNPGVDRLVMSVLMEFDPDGRAVKCIFTPGVISSARRMTYTAVHAILSGDESARREYAPLAGVFKKMEELATILNRRRRARGSIDFDLPEPEITFNAQGQMMGVVRSERNIAHRIIEEFMLAANEAVANFLEGRGIPLLYRIHEKPDPKKVIEFEEIAATFGYSLGMELPAMRRVRVKGRDERQRVHRAVDLPTGQDFKITPHDYQRLTERISGKPEERILSYLMLRSLKQARYSSANDGHFALAANAYTHFTSPIRRYPDLIVHRILKAALAREAMAKAAVDGGKFYSASDLRLLAEETSEGERRAAEAERELIAWKKVTFMAGRIGDEFEALVISVTKNGLFIELENLFVEGFVPIESFGGVGWVYRQDLRAIVSTDRRRAWRLGDAVAVRLDRVDRDGNKLVFSALKVLPRKRLTTTEIG